MNAGQRACKGIRSRLGDVFAIACLFLAEVYFTACSSREGWGVLLWSTEEPPVQSGTVLPVYIRSNIDKVWVLGLPAGVHGEKTDKIEVPLSRFEFAGSRAKANKRAKAFSRYALTYAENLQDGLPVRDSPDNNARRVYRLRNGEIVKILSLAEGNPAVGATGAPLPGDWYRILTADGSTGYCFSYRLKLFEHTSGPFVSSVPVTPDAVADPDLDLLMSKTWTPESYSIMVDNGKIDLEDLSRRWHFDPGQDTGVARIYVPNVDLSFSYDGIRPDGRRTWRFEGTSLLVQLRSDILLAVQYTEGDSGIRTLLFVAMPVDVDDIIVQENARRNRLYNAIYSRGPVFTSNNYGTIIFREGREFSWTGYDILVPQLIPESADGKGTISMDLFLVPELEEQRYTGAFTMRFAGSGGAVLRCMYYLDNQGFRIEIVPESSIEEVITVTRRDASPMVLYFFRDTMQESRSD